MSRFIATAVETDQSRPLLQFNSQYLQSTCGHLAVVQPDGNFVLYDSIAQPYFSSATSGQGVAPMRLTLQASGQLVMFDSVGRCVLYLFHLISCGRHAVCSLPVSFALSLCSHNAAVLRRVPLPISQSGNERDQTSPLLRIQAHMVDRLQGPGGAAASGAGDIGH
jgi:hypothetical protein